MEKFGDSFFGGGAVFEKKKDGGRCQLLQALTFINIRLSKLRSGAIPMG